MSMSHVFLTLTVLCGAVAPANILGFFGMPSISHQQVFQVIWKELSLRGHNVTVVTPNPLNDPSLTNLTEIDVSSSYQFVKDMEHILSRPTTHWDFLDIMRRMSESVNKIQFDHPKVKKLLEDKDTNFDVVLVEPVTFIPCAFR